jgi:uncharacterized protein
MTTRLIPYAVLEASAWKNGGGSTTVIMIAPPGAGDDFDWRVSLATIAQSGPFSDFPGIDRTLALVEGAGVVLDVDASRRRILDASSPDFVFVGEAAVNAEIIEGPSTDFNVMTRRAHCNHQFGRRKLEGVSEFAPRGNVTLLFLADGEGLEVANDVERMSMVRYDTVMLEPGTVWKLSTSEATVFVVDIYYQ